MFSPPPHRAPFRPSIVWLISLVGALVVIPLSLRAQTDYYNTDTGRPLRVEDAYATERYSLDLHLAPFTIERRAGAYAWSVDPELAYGLLPRTQIEVGLPVASVMTGAGRRTGIAGVDLTTLYNLNVETAAWPALGMRAGALLPVGPLGPTNVHPSIQAMATRTYQWARVHANVAYTFGSEPGVVEGAELDRSIYGLAVDRTFPLSSILLSGELFAAQPLEEARRTEWNAGVGIRYQLTPYYSFDAGVGRQFTGDERTWSITFGLARVLGVRVLPPGFGRWRD